MYSSMFFWSKPTSGYSAPGLDQGPRTGDTINTIYSPQDQPKGLVRGSVFLASPVSAGRSHAY
jgi:hypothetical protein